MKHEGVFGDGGRWGYNGGCHIVCLQAFFYLLASERKFNYLRARGSGIFATLERLKASGAYGVTTAEIPDLLSFLGGLQRDGWTKERMGIDDRKIYSNV